MKYVSLITGASSGFGRLIANALAAAGHTVYASMRGLHDKNAAQVGEVAAYAERHKVDLRTLELDVQSDRSVASAVAAIVDAPFGKRPFRVVIDPASDGSAVTYPVIDRVREEFLRRIGFADLLRPTDHGAA